MPNELVRSRALSALATRFDHPITAVVAGAGFGKSTALAQAIRSNEAAPRGLDAWIACEQGDEDAEVLATALGAALGRPAGDTGRLDHVVGALWDLAPIEVCLVIDDLHELPPGSGGEQLVSGLTARLPPHAHLVLASRHALPMALARQRAAGRVRDIGPDELAFTDAEVAALAIRAGRQPAACADLAGWPSLVRLVLFAPPGAAREFLWEEIVAGLTPAERAGLLALAVLGSGTADEVARVAGREVDAVRLVRTVPLLHEDPDGQMGAHHLWAGEVERIYPPAELRDARRRALDVMRHRGETVRLGTAAVRWGDADGFRLACLALVAENLGALPAATADRWLANPPPGAAASPELDLLTSARALNQRLDPDQADRDLDAIEARFMAEADADGQAVTLALAGAAALLRGDALRLAAIVGRLDAVATGRHRPLAEFLVATIEAAGTALGGDLVGALRAIEAVPSAGIPPFFAEWPVQFRAMMLVLLGRAPEALALAPELLASSNPVVRSIPSLLRWEAGDPTEYLAWAGSTEARPDVGRHYGLFRSTHLAVVAAAIGNRRLAREMRHEIEAAMVHNHDGRDRALAATALAACAVLEHDEAAAAAFLADHIERHPLGHDTRVDTHLRQRLAIGYVLSAQARRHWDQIELGPAHQQARGWARLLTAARQGQLDRRVELGPPEAMVPSLPLPWSAELAVRARQADCPGGETLVQVLSAWLPANFRREVVWLAETGDPSVRAAATRLLEDLPRGFNVPLRIEVLGPLRLRRGGRDTGGAGLRRARVRTLLTLLVLRGDVRRDRVCDLLWPDLPPTAAARNLRVTLSHLRSLLEPDRAEGRSSSMIRSTGEVIALAGRPLIETDIEQVRRDLLDAERAEEAGDVNTVMTCLARVIGSWRGDPLPDVALVDDLAGEVEPIVRSLLDACLKLGELQLVAGRFDEALRCADRGRTADPYSERAHRLSIACHLKRRDRSGLEAAVRATEELLADFGAEPEETTRMLINRAVDCLGPGPRRSGLATG